MNEASVKRLGEARPGEKGGEIHSEFVDPTPVVLWSGARPAAVLVHRVEEDSAARTLVEEFVRLSDGLGEKVRGLVDAFPVTNRTRSAVKMEEGERLDLFAEGLAVAADVNGDGVDELVLPRQLGGVDVVGLKGVLFRYPASGSPAVATYTPVRAQVARLGSRSVVHLLFRRKLHGGADGERAEAAGAGDRYQLVRVDGRGATRVVLRDLGFSPQAVLAVGAINRPGSADVDELVVLSRKDEGQDAWVSRHRPDGSALAPARKIYVPFGVDAPWEIEFLPQSGVAVVHAPGRPEVYFVEPEKPVNWVRVVDLKPAVGSEPAQLAGVLDANANPKAVVLAGDALFAVDAAGIYHAGAGGSVAPSRGPAPLLRLQRPGPLFGPPVVVPSAARGDEVLVAYTHPRTSRALSREEVAKAADLYLPPKTVARQRKWAEPSLTDDDPVRDGLVEEERKRRRVDQDIATVEDWKRLLPDSYAAVAQRRQDDLQATLEGRLTHPLDDPEQLAPDQYVNLDSYRTWLAALAVPAETVFEVVRRGAPLRSFRVEGGELGPFTSSHVGRWRLEWRADATEATVVATMTFPDAKGRPAPGFYAVRAGAR